MSEFSSDPRYALCSELGRAELEVYLQWLKDASLEDTEYAFVAYVVGRAQLADARHLFAIWEHQMGGQIDRATRSQIRRFFMNPSQTVSFQQATYAGWFDFVPAVYQTAPGVPAPSCLPPLFAKVGYSDLPERIA